MSIYLATSPKHCGSSSKTALVEGRRLNRRFLWAVTSILLSLASAAFLIWLIFHPSKPEFYLRDADVSELSQPSPRLLNSTIFLSLVARNPNSRVGIYYDHLRAYATYRGQQITAGVELPPFYQGHDDTNLLTASLSGTGVPVAASFGYEVSRDQISGRVPLKLRIDGRIRWKVGSWVSGQYRIDVECVAIVGFRAAAAAAIDGSGLMSTLQGTQCSTSV